MTATANFTLTKPKNTIGRKFTTFDFGIPGKLCHKLLLDIGPTVRNLKELLAPGVVALIFTRARNYHCY